MLTCLVVYNVFEIKKNMWASNFNSLNLFLKYGFDYRRKIKWMFLLWRGLCVGLDHRFLSILIKSFNLVYLNKITSLNNRNMKKNLFSFRRRLISFVELCIGNCYFCGILISTFVLEFRNVYTEHKKKERMREYYLDCWFHAYTSIATVIWYQNKKLCMRHSMYKCNYKWPESSELIF